MKKKIILLGIMAFLILASVVGTQLFSKTIAHDQDKIKVVTSFFPVYVATANVVEGVDGVELVNLTQNQGGCLHDYQLTTEDMKELENADVFIINGAGMEMFLDDIKKAYPKLMIIDSSQGINLLKGQEDHHHGEDEGEGEEHDHGEWNGHYWLSTKRYMQQIDNIGAGLMKKESAYKKDIEGNVSNYKKKILQLQEESKEQLANMDQLHVIIFHDAFAYLAEEVGVEVVHAVNMDENTALSAGEMAEVVEEVKKEKIKVLFTEEQYSDSIAKGVAEETGAKVYSIDTLVSGEFHKDAYINGMKENIKVLKEALAQ